MPPLPSALLKTVTLMIFFCECAPVPVSRDSFIDLFLECLECWLAQVHATVIGFRKKKKTRWLCSSVRSWQQCTALKKKVWFFFRRHFSLIMQGCLHLFIMPVVFSAFVTCALFIYEAKRGFSHFNSFPTSSFRINIRFFMMCICQNYKRCKRCS